MEYCKLNSKAVTSFRIKSAFTFIFAVVVSVILMIIGKNVWDGDYSYIFFIASGLITLAAAAALIVYPHVEYRQWKYGISEDRVEIEHGIFFVKKTVIPIIRIQNITVSQGPVKRKLNLYDVGIYTASDNFGIPCLDKETADEISTSLKDGIYKRLEESKWTVK